MCAEWSCGSDARLGDIAEWSVSAGLEAYQPMPTRYPREFRDDVIRIALIRRPEATLAQIAQDFGIHVGTLDKWLREERVEAGQKPGVTRSENAELREARKRNKLLEQQLEVSSCGRAHPRSAPAGERLYPLVQRARQ